MNNPLNAIMDTIGETYKEIIEIGSRYYLEVSIGKQAAALGYTDLVEQYAQTYAIVPLKAPLAGMKVRIDGRTFDNYAQHASGIAVPAYVASATGQVFEPFVPNDSMICYFSRVN